MIDYALIVCCFGLAVSQLCLLLYVAKLNWRLKAAEAFIQDAFKLLFPAWLARGKLLYEVEDASAESENVSTGSPESMK